MPREEERWEEKKSEVKCIGSGASVGSKCGCRRGGGSKRGRRREEVAFSVLISETIFRHSKGRLAFYRVGVDRLEGKESSRCPPFAPYSRLMKMPSLSLSLSTSAAVYMFGQIQTVTERDNPLHPWQQFFVTYRTDFPLSLFAITILLYIYIYIYWT